MKEGVEGPVEIVDSMISLLREPAANVSFID